MKKLFFLLICLGFISQAVLAKEIAVNVTPALKLTTANMKLMPGDKADFVVAEDVKVNSITCFKKGDKVTGVVTSREENGFLGQDASMCIENLYTINPSGKRVKLKGIVYKKGRSHDVVSGFVVLSELLNPITSIIRGGEVQMEPNKDIFTVYMEGK